MSLGLRLWMSTVPACCVLTANSCKLHPPSATTSRGKKCRVRKSAGLDHFDAVRLQYRSEANTDHQFFAWHVCELALRHALKDGATDVREGLPRVGKGTADRSGRWIHERRITRAPLKIPGYEFNMASFWDWYRCLSIKVASYKRRGEHREMHEFGILLPPAWNGTGVWSSGRTEIS
ncbi:hypothetical protein C8F04DRAFT_1304845 [Mycena alexandri]|uniref:Uncharacterized protein n=1 Tax=Mycena alexandri TaxID=1745969 RepID=A0AAD6SAB3_9AGAR|nr:hypothetical protein C8F04DRAFT_1304845 [Mycena alexandri]